MLFLLFVIAGGIVGATMGAEYGEKLLGLPGGILGFLIGGYLGLWIGRLPYDLGMMWIRFDLGRKSLDQLRAMLRHSNPYLPNCLLLELKRRGEDIQQHLPLVLSLMEASDSDLRVRGLAALQSAFPELAERLRDYRIGGPAEARREAIRRMMAPDEPAEAPGS